MPVYEFYCDRCNTLFNFYSRTVNTSKRPRCPKCKKKNLERQLSIFASVSRAGGDEDGPDLPVDESRMEKAMEMLAKEAEGINEDDPRQAAKLMRRLSDATGMSPGPGLEEALKRLEAGEDPEQIEAEMGDLIEEEEPFVFEGKKGGAKSGGRPPFRRDDTLYEL
ncbi:MAG: zinc ribbon domain-containing protein [Deltaproteobacteria bacterium]|nr:zinc ribbon domain-containing protein [Deltaproteobacteria bacterium]